MLFFEKLLLKCTKNCVSRYTKSFQLAVAATYHCGININRKHRHFCFYRSCINYSSKLYISSAQPFFQFSCLETKIPQDKTKHPIIAADVIESRKCTTYATADQFKFVNLVDYLSKNIHFELITLPIDAINASMLLVTDENLTEVKENGYIVLFRAGVISFWNLSEHLVKHVLRLVQKYEIESYKVNIVHWEMEKMNYKYITGKSRFKKNSFEISNTSDFEKLCCEIYAFSHALMASVKLAHWEHSLDGVVRSIESLPHALMEARSLNRQSSKTVHKKLGEVLMIRHRLNLQYNMLDVPDEYWDEEELENLYTCTAEFLNVRRRVHVMNEKLSYCCHIIELVKSHIAQSKSLRIEIWIVLLILIEVLFELFHFYVKPYLNVSSDKE